MNEREAAQFAELLSNAGDLLETARRIKGDRFAVIAAHLFEGMQVLEILARLGVAAGALSGSEAAQQHVDQGTLLLSAMSVFLVQELSPEDRAEVVKLAEQMADRTIHFHEQLLAKG